MTAQKGKDMLVKLHNGSIYETVAGLRAKQLAFNEESVDITDSESAGRWRELLGGAGVRRCGLTGSGLFKDQASDETVRSAFFAGSLIEAQIIIPDFGSLTGPFLMTALEYSGQHNGEVTFDLTLESAGAISFGAAS